MQIIVGVFYYTGTTDTACSDSGKFESVATMALQTTRIETALERTKKYLDEMADLNCRKPLNLQNSSDEIDFPEYLNQKAYLLNASQSSNKNQPVRKLKKLDLLLVTPPKFIQRTQRHFYQFNGKLFSPLHPQTERPAPQASYQQHPQELQACQNWF